MGEGLVEDLGCQILSVVVVARALVHIVIDPVNVLFVQETEGFWISLGLFNQVHFVYQLVHQDSLIDAAGLAY
jgi:hypothetical protein